MTRRRPSPTPATPPTSPTVWVNQANPGQSLILGNDKKGSFESYDLNGDLVQRITDATPFWGNSDVRPNVTIGGFHGDLIAVVARHGLQGVHRRPCDPAAAAGQRRQCRSAPATPKALCMYDSPGGTVYVTTLKREGAILRQFRLSDDDGNGQITATQLRQFHVGGIAEVASSTTPTARCTSPSSRSPCGVRRPAQQRPDPHDGRLRCSLPDTSSTTSRDSRSSPSPVAAAG